jgi:hypothetical protein
MIGYRIHFEDNINWEKARENFAKFLSRHLNIHISSVVIEGIVSGTDTWYIMKDTKALLKALNISQWSKFDLVFVTLAAVVLILFGFQKLKH